MRFSWSRTILLAACLLMAPCVVALQFPPAATIAAQWPFDVVTGTTTPDVSGNGNTATLVNAPTTVAGIAGTGLQFNGSTQNLTAADSASLDVASGSFSAAAWVKPGAATAARILNKWDGTKGWILDINTTTGGAAAAGYLRAKLSDGTTTIDYSLSGPVATGTWQHIAVTVDRTAKQLKLFLNGVQIGTTQDLTTLTGSLTNTALFGMGTIPATTGNYYNGVLDEPILYKRVLTGAEVASLATMPPPAPTGLTHVNGVNQVTLNWTASAGATTYAVLRSRTSGGPVADPYVVIASGVSGLTYTDLTAAYPGTYYYVVEGVAGSTPSSNSNETPGTPLPIPVTALPNTGLQTNENGATTTFTITFNVPAPAGGSTVTVTTSDVTEGVPSSPGLASTPVLNGGGQTIGFSVNVTAGTSPSITVLVTGVDDALVDGPVPYQINVTATNIAVPIPPVMVTNNDNDTAGITYSQTSGIVTSEDGTQASFWVVLNRQPFGTVSWSLTSSNTNEGTVLPGSLTFTNGNWSTAQTVTVTGVDDTVLDFTQPYQIVPGTLTFTDPKDQAAFQASGVTSAPTVFCENLDNEVPPALPTVWGGGCGLMGAELLLPWISALALRRRRRTSLPAS
jgi:hypothetical protein